MINNLTALGFGIITFAILIGIGLVILSSLGTSVAGCPTGFLYQANLSGTVYTTELCCNATAVTCTSGLANESITPSVATSNMNAIAGYLGTSSGGLTTWIPVVIVLIIGMLFLGAFMSRKGLKA